MEGVGFLIGEIQEEKRALAAKAITGKGREGNVLVWGGKDLVVRSNLTVMYDVLKFKFKIYRRY